MLALASVYSRSPTAWWQPYRLPRSSFCVTLVDSDEVNGFSIAGGHIYIHRKLAAVAKSDDELAGVIGHEIGHIISHQFAFETRALDEFDGTMVGEALGGALVVAQIGNPDMNQQKAYLSSAQPSALGAIRCSVQRRKVPGALHSAPGRRLGRGHR